MPLVNVSDIKDPADLVGLTLHSPKGIDLLIEEVLSYERFGRDSIYVEFNSDAEFPYTYWKSDLDGGWLEDTQVPGRFAIRKFLEDGKTCPWCGSDDHLEFDLPSLTSTRLALERNVQCHKCFSVWTVFYQIESIYYNEG